MILYGYMVKLLCPYYISLILYVFFIILQKTKVNPIWQKNSLQALS